MHDLSKALNINGHAHFADEARKLELELARQTEAANEMDAVMKSAAQQYVEALNQCDEYRKALGASVMRCADLQREVDELRRPLGKRVARVLITYLERYV